VAGAANVQRRLLIAFIPLLALAVDLALFRYLRRWWQGLADLLRPAAVLVAVLVLLVFACGALAYGARKGAFSDQLPYDFARNPHLHMARSCVERLMFSKVEDPGDIDSTDFEPGRTQPGLYLDR